MYLSKTLGWRKVIPRKLSGLLLMSMPILLIVTNVHAQRRPDRPPLNPLEQLNRRLQHIVTKVSPAIVQVEVSGFSRSNDDTSNEKSDTHVLTKTQSIASGVILAPDGYIVTNAHVVEGARRIHVILDERSRPSSAQAIESRLGLRFEARVVGRFEGADLALLKIDAQGLPTIPLADSETVAPGQLVFTVGSPEGLKNSVSMGVISAVARQDTAERTAAYIQTDAAINAGSSGGALVDVNGKLVGITSFILSEGGGNEGLGFALPSNLVQVIYRELKAEGHVRVGDIGMKVQGITPTLAKGLGLSRESGVVVSDIRPDSPSGNAGLQVQDLLLTLDGNPVRTPPEFAASFYSKRGGDHVKLEVLRNLRRLAFDIPVLESVEESADSSDAIDSQSSLVAKLGILCVPLNEKLRSATAGIRSSSGVVVVAKLAHGDLRRELVAGDLIRSVNATATPNVEALRSIVDTFNPGDAIVLQIERRGQFKYISFEMD